MSHAGQFSQPKDANEALELLWELKEEATLIAGGTDLTLDIRRGIVDAAALINIRNLKELSYLSVEGDLVRIGATTTLATLISDLPHEAVSLRRAAGHIGSRQIRNMATVGGNLCRASSVGDLGVVFLSLDGRVRLTSRSGERYCPVEQFFLGGTRIDRKPEELLTEVSFRLSPETCGEAYEKFSSTTRKSIPLVSLAVTLCREGTGGIRAAVGGLSDRPVRLRSFEERINGREGLADLSSALEQVRRDIAPVDDRYGSADYKTSLAETLVGRAVTDLSGKMKAAPKKG